MAARHLIEMPVSRSARLAFAKIRRRRGISDTEIAAALVEWFASRDAEEQGKILESRVARERCAEVVGFRPPADLPPAERG